MLVYLNSQHHKPFSLTFKAWFGSQCFVSVEGDHITRILKLYGDALERPDGDQMHALSRSDVSNQQMYLRCIVLLVRLTGKYVARFLPQVRIVVSCLDSFLRYYCLSSWGTHPITHGD